MTIRNNQGRLEVTMTKKEYADYAAFCNIYMFIEDRYDVEEILASCDDYVTIDEDMLSTPERINDDGMWMYEDDFWYLVRKAFNADGTTVDFRN